MVSRAGVMFRGGRERRERGGQTSVKDQTKIILWTILAVGVNDKGGEGDGALQMEGNRIYSIYIFSITIFRMMVSS